MHPRIELVARELVAHPQAETRSWAATLLGRIDRERSASDELRRLLVDPHAEVRTAAIGALQAIDLVQAGWLEQILPDILAIASPSELNQLAVQVDGLVDPVARASLCDAAEIMLQEEPESAGARVFAATLLL